MPENYKKHGLFFLVLILLFLTLLFFYLDWRNSHRGFTFAMLDVGQGDGLFIESPTGTQVLVDSGPPKKLLGKLVGMMPFFDRSIDILIITNPDTDHIGSFVDIVKNYKIGMVVEPGTYNESKTYQNLKQQITDKNIPVVLAQAGMEIDLGGGARMEILFPDRDVSLWDTNDGSMIARVWYGETSIMLTGDASSQTEKIILQKYGAEYLDSDILKVGHHGSRTSSSYSFVDAVSPEYAFISNGKDNKYGHPHIDTLETLAYFGAKILRTDLLGTIILSCDRIETCKINK